MGLPKLACVVVAALAVVSCESATDKLGNARLKDDAIYLRDIYGRCLRMLRNVNVFGTNVTQSGTLDVFVVSNAICDAKMTVGP